MLEPLRPLLRWSLCLLALLPPATYAEVYRWTDAQGAVHYGDRPPTPGAKPAQLPPLQLIPGSSSATRPPTAAGTAPAPTTPAHGISVVSPTPDQTLRNTDRTLRVSVQLSQPLPEGGGLLYLLDGNPRTPAPIRDLSYAITDVDRGTHMVSAAVVDGRGKELGRAAPVLVHLLPPGLK